MFQVQHTNADGIGYTTRNYPDIINITYNHHIKNPLARYNVAVIFEPTPIVPISHINLTALQEFDLVLSYRDDLSKLPNFRFMPFGTVWVDPYKEREKENIISFLTSSKLMTPNHRFRYEVFDALVEHTSINEFDIICKMTPPRIEKKDEILDNSKFSIIIENDNSNNYFTEKIIDCFASKTIPIYYGCPNIEDFFDPGGIIKFNSLPELINIICALTPEDYDKSLGIVENNFVESQKYFDVFDNIYKIIEREFYGK
jgi:hypothetical protein